jgi:hypothetical protein
LPGNIALLRPFAFILLDQPTGLTSSNESWQHGCHSQLASKSSIFPGKAGLQLALQAKALLNARAVFFKDLQVDPDPIPAGYGHKQCPDSVDCFPFFPDDFADVGLFYGKLNDESLRTADFFNHDLVWVIHKVLYDVSYEFFHGFVSFLMVKGYSLIILKARIFGYKFVACNQKRC